MEEEGREGDEERTREEGEGRRGGRMGSTTSNTALEDARQRQGDDKTGAHETRI